MHIKSFRQSHTANEPMETATDTVRRTILTFPVIWQMPLHLSVFPGNLIHIVPSSPQFCQLGAYSQWYNNNWIIARRMNHNVVDKSLCFECLTTGKHTHKKMGTYVNQWLARQCMLNIEGQCSDTWKIWNNDLCSSIAPSLMIPKIFQWQRSWKTFWLEMKHLKFERTRWLYFLEQVWRREV